MPPSKQRIKKGPTDPINTKMVVLNIRHSEDVAAFINKKAAETNDYPSALRRKILNAGLEALYPIKIIGNQIIEDTPPRC